jgi:hypothetical protein
MRCVRGASSCAWRGDMPAEEGVGRRTKKPRGSLPRGLAVDLIAMAPNWERIRQERLRKGYAVRAAPSSWRYPRSPPIQSEIVTGSPPSRKKIPGQPLVTRCFRPFPPRTVARGTSPGPHPLRVGRRGPCRAFPVLERVGNDRCPDGGSIGACGKRSMVFSRFLGAETGLIPVGVQRTGAGSTDGTGAAILPPR